MRVTEAGNEEETHKLNTWAQRMENRQRATKRTQAYFLPKPLIHGSCHLRQYPLCPLQQAITLTTKVNLSPPAGGTTALILNLRWSSPAIFRDGPDFGQIVFERG